MPSTTSLTCRVCGGSAGVNNTPSGNASLGPRVFCSSIDSGTPGKSAGNAAANHSGAAPSVERCSHASSLRPWLSAINASRTRRRGSALDAFASACKSLAQVIHVAALRDASSAGASSSAPSRAGCMSARALDHASPAGPAGNSIPNGAEAAGVATASCRAAAVAQNSARTREK
jgi:hypothetical protein